MSGEQQWRIVDIVPISPRKQLRPYPVSPTDEGTSSLENRLEATHCPSMQASTSVDQSQTLQPVNIPIPPGRGSIDQMVAMHNVMIPTPPGSVTVPSMDRMEVMCSATIPTPPASAPEPCMDRMVAMCNATIPTPPACMPSPQTASLPQPPPLNNLERMKIAVIPIPPSAATVPSAPNTDQLEEMCNAVIPQVPLARIEMMDEQLQPPSLTGGNVDHPHQFTSIEVVDGQTQPSTTTGDAPTPDEHQALEWAGLATSNADDDFLHMLQTFKSQHGADFPPVHFPYNKQLDRHIVQVQNVQAGQYTVDMIDLLEVLCHPHVGYSLQPYTGGPPYPSRQSAIEMAIVYLGCCIECAVIHLLGWYANLCLDMVMISGTEGAGTPHPGNHITGKLQSHFASMLSCIFMVPRGPGFVSPWWVDGSLQYTVDFKQMRGARIFPIAHKYFQWLSMGDWIDEWIEEKVSAYMITVRGVVHELEKNEQDINHLFSWWFALSRLLGLQDA
ncbi:hypothetical protein F5141DRAFT_1060269 [Pisolithus sp. B1]|nr:hypothetical protein F5141DRAFT_1060269 [Pisolithus sp. B1]